MDPESVDVVITSPPYNIKKDYGTYQDDLPYADYLFWMEEIFKELKRVLKNNGSFFLNVGSTCKQPFIATDVANEARKHFICQNHIIWTKSVSVMENGEWKSYGHFKPIVSKRFLNLQHESIYHFTKDGDLEINRLAVGVPYRDKSNIARWKGKKIDKRCRGNVWHLPYKTVKAQKQHPAGFPVELPENCILLHGFSENLMVFDPFLGAGSTLLACKALGCNGIGTEIDPEFCKSATENLAL